jgi:tripartite ATP-independent periplasmic transporter solute receptor, DctP family
MLRRFLVTAIVFAFSLNAAAGQIVLKWGDTQGPTHISVQMIDRIAKDVKEKTDGRVEIQNYPGGQMGGSLEMIEAVSMGMLEMTTEGAANFAQFVPAIGVMESPYVWRDAAHLVKVMNGPIGQDFNRQLIAQTGMRILGATYYGARQLTTTSREIRSVADMAELKIRVPENEVFLEMAKAWGAKPTPMTFNELYLALKQNVVDAQENPLPTIEAGKFHEVQKYLVMTYHIITPRLIVINEATFQKISPEDQAVLMQSVADGIQWNNDQIEQKEKELVTVFSDYGVTVIEVDIDEFRQPILDKVVPQFEGKWGKGMYEKILAE